MGHYFDDQPGAGSAPRQVDLWLPDMSLTLTTDRGVFGYGQIDAGSKLLLLKAPHPPQHGNLLDLGCGVGTISVPLARRAPGATVWAIDVNARARDLCAANAVSSGVANIAVVAPDQVPAGIEFECIWSNPPIRVGKPALHALMLTWLARLVRGGYAVFVVHKHLGSDSLQRWLTEQGYPTRRLTSSGGYRILHTVRVHDE